jgi:hypothetical protein
VLLEQPRHLGRREVLAVLADPVVGPAVEEEVALAVLDQDVAQVAGVVDAGAVLALVRPGVVEVALEQRRVRRDRSQSPTSTRITDQMS